MQENDNIEINGKNYSVIEKIDNEGKSYYLAVGIINNKYSFYDIILFEIVNNEIQLVTDTDLIKKVCGKFVEE